ncbi:MAG: M3 family metallopeptidase, partial [Pseudoruegeria sp.]
MTNPLLQDWDTPFKLPPFDTIKDEDFEPAFEAALAKARSRVAAIADQTAAPSFANTIEAMEEADALLGRVLGVFYNIAGSDSNAVRQGLQRKFSPGLAAYGSEITMNTALYSRIETLWAARDTLGLNDEQMRVLTLTRRSFVRAGAQLIGDPATRLKDVKERLAVLGTEFTQNLLKDEADWYMELSEADLEGLPGFVLAAAKAAADEKGVEGHVVTLSRSLIVPFLQFSPRRDLREKAFKAWEARGANGGDTDNLAITSETLSLRQERANLLGYDTFSDFKLETEMAKTPEAVRELLMAVWEPAKAQANADAAILTKMMQADGINADLEAWDWRYYAAKRKTAE